MTKHALFHLALAFSIAGAGAACSVASDVLTGGPNDRPDAGSGGGGGDSGGGGEVDGGGGGGGGGGGDGGDTAGPPVECKAGLTSVTVTLPAQPSGPVYAATMPDDGTTLAWASGGQVHVRRIDWDGAALGADRKVAGNTVHGLAPMSDGVALLVARAPDVLALVKLSDAGAVAFERVLVGNEDHAAQGSEWFAYEPQFFAQSGRLVWSGSSLFAYAPIYRRWPDGIAHTGDTLRVFDAAGAPKGGGWGWGCSHSLDVRLSTDGAQQVCLSDCYPEKGILSGGRTLVSADPSGDCLGRSDAKLGGIATVGANTWITFATREGRATRDVALVKLGETTKRWLTEGKDATAPHLAAHGAGLIAGWRAGGASLIQSLDATGAPIGAPTDVSTLAFADSDDFLSWPNGDAGWLVRTGTTVKVARLGACE